MLRRSRVQFGAVLVAGATLGFLAASGRLSFDGSAFAADEAKAPPPGSPAATTTIDGKQLPPPPPVFGGTINMAAKDSKSYWPAQIVPPKGAPNVLLIMTDDQGYG